MARCAGGVCVADCGGLDRCGDACVDFDTDPLNCGGCGDNCSRDQICVAGNCRDFGPALGCTMCPCAACTGDTDQCCTHPTRATDLICAERCP